MRSGQKWILGSGVWLLCRTPAAQAFQKNIFEQQSTVSTHATAFSPVTYLLQTFAALILIGLIFFALLWLIKKFYRIGNRLNNPIRMIAAYPLNAKDRLLLLSIEGEYLLVSAAPGNVQLLHKFDSGFVLNQSNAEESTQEHVFARYIRQYMASGKSME